MPPGGADEPGAKWPLRTRIALALWAMIRRLRALRELTILYLAVIVLAAVLCVQHALSWLRDRKTYLYGVRVT